MPLHLLGKKSWNVYNKDNIARVKADEAAAAEREAEEERRLDEIDAQRRLAILRGVTPPPLPKTDPQNSEKSTARPEKSGFGHDRKRRRLAGEDDTDRDIRLAKSVTAPRDEDADVPTMRLRKPELDVPLTDHAGNISLFPVDEKAAIKHQKNAEAEAEKKKKERDLEDQYTMRFSNAAGKGGLENPWYTSKRARAPEVEVSNPDQKKMLDYPGFESKDVWGREDPHRKERAQARISTTDPFAFMQKAQNQLKQAERDKKRWDDERDREVRELRAAREREDRRQRHGKRKKRIDDEDDLENFSLDTPKRHGSQRDKGQTGPSEEQMKAMLAKRAAQLGQPTPSAYGVIENKDTRHRHHRSRSRDRKHERTSSHRHARRPSRSRERSRERNHHRSGNLRGGERRYGEHQSTFEAART